ncbi:MAG: hypothetical protein OXC46_00195 [Thaumarchaeota archaeon]|nr:hypothetical protein [Nitrososphaerota archaeon]
MAQSDDVKYWINEVMSAVTALKYLHGDELIDAALEDARFSLRNLEIKIKGERELRKSLDAFGNVTKRSKS